MIIQISKRISLTLPENYQKIELPFFDEWITALKSGEYKQGGGKLCNFDDDPRSYCCLGVLVDVCLQKSKRLPPRKAEITGCYLAEDNPCFSVLGVAGRLPESVIIGIGQILKPELIDYYPDRNHPPVALSRLNDNGSANFEDIAKIIEHVYCPATIQ